MSMTVSCLEASSVKPLARTFWWWPRRPRNFASGRHVEITDAIYRLKNRKYIRRAAIDALRASYKKYSGVDSRIHNFVDSGLSTIYSRPIKKF